MDEYVALEASSSTRHEFFDGEIYGMAGGSPDHAALAATMLRLLGNSLPPECQAFSSDLRVHVEATGLTTYPDATVVCGKTERADADRFAVTNPLVLVEVTSPSTESYDRGEKLAHYKSIASVKAIVIVAHDKPSVSVYLRDASDNWQLREVGASEHFTLPGLTTPISMGALYQRALEDAPT